MRAPGIDPNAESGLLFLASCRLYAAWRLFRRNEPHYKPGAVRAIERYLTREAHVFEWGCGTSTIWFGLRAGRVVAIEHDPGWWEGVRQELRDRGLDTVDCRLSPPLSPQELASRDWRREWPRFAALGHPPRRPEFQAYVAEIDRFPDEGFDLVAVDGRERVGCVLHAGPKVKPGGWLVLDDAHRPKYSEVFDILSSWKRRTYRFGRIATAIFRKL